MIEGNVRSEKIRTLYRQTTPIVVANALNSIIVGLVLWGSAPNATVLGWVSAMCTLSLARLVLSRQYLKRAPRPADAARWGWLFVGGSAAAGTL